MKIIAINGSPRKGWNSDELLENKGVTDETCHYKARINGSLCHITAIFGMTIAGEIIKDITDKCG